MEYYGWVLLKFLTGFVIVITHLNLSGKTQLSQMTPVDLIGNFVIGGIIGGVIYSDAIPFYQYVIVLLMGVSLISILNALARRVSFFRSVAIGDAIPIIKDGRFLTDIIADKKNKIDILAISSQLHSQGIHSFQEIIYAQIEPDGQVTAVCEGGHMPSVIIMKDGGARLRELERIERDETWLSASVRKAGIKPDDVYIAEFWDGRLTFITMDGSVLKIQ